MSRRARRMAALVLPMALALGGAVAAGPAAQAVDAAHCPKPSRYVKGVPYKVTRIAPGLTLAEAKLRDSRGYVDIHVLRADLRAVKPVALHGAMADRAPLTRLARRRDLLAAVNTGFFDFITGAPLGAVVLGGRPVVMATEADRVVGFTTDRRAQAGQVTLTGEVDLPGYGSMPLAGLNYLFVPAGLSAYTSAWGRESDIDLPDDAVSRAVDASGRLLEGTGVTLPPPRGMVLVARGHDAALWLQEAPVGTPVGLHSGYSTDAPRPFSQAYAVGDQLFFNGVPRTDIGCRAGHPQPARTAIGFSRDGRLVTIALVTDRPTAHIHGLDQGQMASLMGQLGVAEAYAFDGSGSTELLVRLPRSRRLTQRTFPSDGQERPMPLGLGFVRG